ncbi:helix-turn-helix transcriptional regulator [Schleiferilactobacillus perolens]|uniref:HTH cro/C1-type domain-containing protein n=1 Tax=Schleiferilactobacillus perolens DSM 12744 TaxID=1423792 RepID=A0A0R1N3X7_9LACO|nr:helix-turn-helix transcriptional regulator [Schleiferilactobacillus perolens]KRL13028.1 hypothetical protein FD09_GL002568 [Schleiferilactobacillus perolens DSM 12744]
MITIEAARVNAGLSQYEAAKRLGFSQKTYIDYEKYRKSLRINMAYKLAGLYNQPFDNIIFLPDDYKTFVVEHRHPEK